MRVQTNFNSGKICFFLNFTGCCESREKNLVTYNVDPLPRHCDWNKWTIWKEKFFNIIKNETLKVESSEILGLILKKVIGPYGLDIIAEYFVFHNSLDEQNFDLLLNKLDIFFYLHRFPRNIKTESIKEYINRLKVGIREFFFSSKFPLKYKLL